MCTDLYSIVMSSYWLCLQQSLRKYISSSSFFSTWAITSHTKLKLFGQFVCLRVNFLVIISAECGYTYLKRVCIYVYVNNVHLASRWLHLMMFVSFSLTFTHQMCVGINRPYKLAVKIVSPFSVVNGSISSCWWVWKTDPFDKYMDFSSNAEPKTTPSVEAAAAIGISWQLSFKINTEFQCCFVHFAFDFFAVYACQSCLIPLFVHRFERSDTTKLHWILFSLEKLSHTLLLLCDVFDCNFQTKRKTNK